MNLFNQNLITNKNTFCKMLFLVAKNHSQYPSLNGHLQLREAAYIMMIKTIYVIIMGNIYLLTGSSKILQLIYLSYLLYLSAPIFNSVTFSSVSLQNSVICCLSFLPHNIKLHSLHHEIITFLCSLFTSLSCV